MHWLACILTRCVAFLFIVAAAVPVRAQSSSDTAVFYVSPDEYEITVPTTCPTHLRGGFTGLIFGYEHEGYAWDVEWIRTRVLTAAGDVAEYEAVDGPHIRSRDGKAIWYNAGIRVRCTATHRYFFGRLVSSYERYVVIANLGTVTPLSGGDGCRDPYEYTTSLGDREHAEVAADDSSMVAPSTCGDAGGSGIPDDEEEGGDSADSSSDSSSATFAAQCESLGGHLYYDIVDLKEWNEETGEWEIVWSGVAAICET